MPTKAELLQENVSLRAQNDLLLAATRQDVMIRDLAAKMHDDGSINVQITAGEEGISHPGIRILAAAALSLLELDGELPPNYRTAQMSGRLASGDEYFVEMAACRSKTQTPHELRMKAETEIESLRAEITRLESLISAPREDVLEIEFQEAWNKIRAFDDYDSPEAQWWRGYAAGVQESDRLVCGTPLSAPKESE